MSTEPSGHPTFCFSPLRVRVKNNVGWPEHFECQMKHSNMKPRCAGVRPSFEVFALASTSVEPCQTTFYHPPQERRLEAVTVRLATHHEQQKPATESRSWMLAVCNATARISTMVFHYGVALASGDLVARVVASGPPFCRGLNRLAIGNDGTGRGRASFSRLPNPGAECLFGAVPGPIIGPVAKVPPNRAPQRRVAGYHAPRYAATQHVQYAVGHFPQVRVRLPSKVAWRQRGS